MALERRRRSWRAAVFGVGCARLLCAHAAMARACVHSWCRVPIKLDDLLTAMETHANEKMRKAGHNEMIREECVAGRLYTGPMYIKYASVGRSAHRPPHRRLPCAHHRAAWWLSLCVQV
jgi:hypothetical protein